MWESSRGRSKPHGLPTGPPKVLILEVLPTHHTRWCRGDPASLFEESPGSSAFPPAPSAQLEAPGYYC